MLLGVAVLAIWLYLLLGRGGFWRMREDLPEVGWREPAPRIMAVIPARNEAAVVGRAIASLAAQRYSGEFRIVLVDDNSSDGTAEIARQASPAGLNTIVRARPVPPGWTGKLWAIAEGIRHSGTFEPDYFLLTDADIVHPGGNLKLLAARAAAGYDLVSFMATLECRTLAERALIPAFVFFFFMLYPPVWIRSARRATAGAAGGCMLIRRAALQRLGGIEAIAGELIDDCALARAVKRQGGRVWLGLSRETRSIRGYAGFAGIGGMISRTAFTQLGHSVALLIATVLAMLLTYVVPPFLALAGQGSAAAIGAFTWLLMAIAYAPILRFYELSVLWATVLPLIAAFYAGATVHSAVAWWRGAGGRWKGRVQDVRKR